MAVFADELLLATAAIDAIEHLIRVRVHVLVAPVADVVLVEMELVNCGGNASEEK